MNDNKTRAHFMRRSAAVLYDTLLLIALFLVLTAIAVALNDGESVSRTLLRLLFLLSTYAFYAWFWLHGGQTLGMRAWRLRLVDANTQTPTWQAINVRFVVAIVSWAVCALGHLWILVDAERRAWHDRASRTYVIYDASFNVSDSNNPSQ